MLNLGFGGENLVEYSSKDIDLEALTDSFVNPQPLVLDTDNYWAPKNPPIQNPPDTIPPSNRPYIWKYQ